MTRYLDPVLLRTVATTATSWVRLNASTLSTFYYEPPHLARLLTTLDVLSDGRLDVGVGLGLLAQAGQDGDAPAKPPRSARRDSR
jgi:alkanesulfonate monooxygenase SsuD/methylene tetrahydromethanopterin reductase-like flavin-dependent oxidoreductase (luciferase family)